jgi:hypothetical protein
MLSAIQIETTLPYAMHAKRTLTLGVVAKPTVGTKPELFSQFLRQAGGRKGEKVSKYGRPK